jgi:membrane fusion protein, multidrug efflux system
VTFDVLRGESFQAPVRYVAATVNPRNRTFEVEVVLPNPGRVIKPEMVANIEIIRRDLAGVLVVPQEAVVRVEEGFVAFVVLGEGASATAQVRPLVLGAAQRNQVIVEEGLSPGDRLIVLGQNQVADGDRVQVLRTREPLQEASSVATPESPSGTDGER